MIIERIGKRVAAQVGWPWFVLSSTRDAEVETAINMGAELAQKKADDRARSHWQARIDAIVLDAIEQERVKLVAQYEARVIDTARLAEDQRRAIDALLTEQNATVRRTEKLLADFTAELRGLRADTELGLKAVGSSVQRAEDGAVVRLRDDLCKAMSTREQRAQAILGRTNKIEERLEAVEASLGKILSQVSTVNARLFEREIAAAQKKRKKRSKRKS